MTARERGSEIATRIAMRRSFVMNVLPQSARGRGERWTERAQVADPGHDEDASRAPEELLVADRDVGDPIRGAPARRSR